VGGLKGGEGTLVEEQAGTGGTGFPAGAVAELVEALDGEDQALAEAAGLGGRPGQAGGQAAQEGFLLGFGKGVVCLGEQGGDQGRQAGFGRLLGEAVKAGGAAAVTAR